MSQITMNVPEEALTVLRGLMPPGIEAGDGLRFLAAVKLYEMGRLSSGAAAAVAGVPRTLFLTRLGDYGVNTFDLSGDELRGEARIA
jgi:predicted HTH domain antitoxin